MRKFYAGLLLVGACGAAGGGCADLRRSVSPPPINPESPVAAQVRAAEPRTFVTPRLADVPPTPRNVPQAPAVKAGVLAMVRCRRGVASFALSHPPLSSGTEQFASSARDAAEVGAIPPGPADAAARSESAAAELRAYAAPPSALASGPAPTAADASPAAPPAPAPSRPQRQARAAPRPGRPPPPAHAGPAPPAAAASVATTSDTVPAFPAPRPDPLLARCS